MSPGEDNTGFLSGLFNHQYPPDRHDGPTDTGPTAAAGPAPSPPTAAAVGPRAELVETFRKCDKYRKHLDVDRDDWLRITLVQVAWITSIGQVLAGIGLCNTEHGGAIGVAIVFTCFIPYYFWRAMARLVDCGNKTVRASHVTALATLDLLEATQRERLQENALPARPG